jgi:cytoskeletal protein CcmA (bactofilin family)
MRPINGVHKGDLRLSGDLTLSGQVRGTVWVVSGTKFECRGQVVGDVVVEHGGTAVVRGMVVGKILNAGGTVDVFGMAAAVNDSENAKTIVHPGAIITGNQRG